MAVRTRRKAANQAESDLQKLAQLYGVETSYDDVSGQRQDASPDALFAVLKVLGAPVNGHNDVGQALRERRQNMWRRCLEPVVLAWDAEPVEALLRFPAKCATRVLECTLCLETGEERRWSSRVEELEDMKSASVDGVDYLVKALRPLEAAPCGYHRLAIELQGQRWETTIVSAPTRAYSPRGRGWERAWGVFLPLYALHSEQSWGAGDVADLQALLEWVRALGGSFVGTLPLLAAFLEEPYEASPYSPVSRLFWNEFYINVPRVPELAGSPAARALLESGEFLEELQSLRSAPLVDYRRNMALKRRVLEELARSFFAAPSDRLSTFEQYAAAHPRLADYAIFRAVSDRLRTPWTDWPTTLRDGNIRVSDYADDVQRYHMYVQWLADEQLRSTSSPESAPRKNQSSSLDANPGLYLDLPLGVNVHGYDVWREREVFALGAAGGCPPDVVFPKGQNWGFVPLHPEGIRNQGYRYVRDYLQHQLPLAAVMRIDHMPSFHRIYWIAPGMEARDGVYVRYPSEEFYAVFCLESHRHRTLLVGEDLGTVPPEVPQAMSRHNVHRMYVVQYEAQPDPREALPDPPAASMASINTHDMPPFAAYWNGQDIAERLEMGLMSQEQAWQEEKNRDAFRDALVRFLGMADGFSRSDDPREAYRACLAFLRDTPSRLAIVNIEDLWLETESQNVPSTSDENPNWRRKARLSLEQFRQRPEVLETLRVLAKGFS
jgi:4-alpha-glucanotransferase